MRKIVALALFAIIASVASAGFTNIVCEFPDDELEDYHTWDWGTDGTPEGIDAWLTLEENLSEVGPDQVDISGATTDDPIFTMTKTVTNEGSVNWTTYNIGINDVGDDNGVSFTNIASASVNVNGTVYTVADAELTITDTLLSFTGGVAPTQVITFNYDILVTTTGTFDFCLCQETIPEPATLAMLGLGALTLIRRKK
jgi:hypothetical protein